MEFQRITVDPGRRRRAVPASAAHSGGDGGRHGRGGRPSRARAAPPGESVRFLIGNALSPVVAAGGRLAIADNIQNNRRLE